MISSGAVEDRLAIRELVESYNGALMPFDGDAWKEDWRATGTWYQQEFLHNRSTNQI